MFRRFQLETIKIKHKYLKQVSKTQPICLVTKQPYMIQKTAQKLHKITDKVKHQITNTISNLTS